MSLLRFSQTFTYFGTLVDEATFGYFKADVDCQFTQVQLTCQTAPTGAAVTVDLLVETATVASAPQGRIATLAIGAKDQVTTLTAALAVTKDSIVRAKIKSIGAGGDPVVPGSDLTMTLIGKFNSENVNEIYPTAVSTCKLYGYQYINGAPSQGTRVSVRLNDFPASQNPIIFQDSAKIVDTSETGYWSVDVVQGQSYLVTIQKSGILNKEITIPLQNTYAFPNSL